MLTAARASELLSYDPTTGVLAWRVSRRGGARPGAVAGSLTSNGYVEVHVDGRPYRAHRLAWLITSGEWPKEQIDHINGIRTDNRIRNLREATRVENNRNQGKRRNNTTGVTGVSWHRGHGKWAAKIDTAGTRRFLGYFDNLEDAVAARRAAEKTYFGEFARRCENATSNMLS